MFFGRRKPHNSLIIKVLHENKSGQSMFSPGRVSTAQSFGRTSVSNCMRGLEMSFKEKCLWPMHGGHSSITIDHQLEHVILR